MGSCIMSGVRINVEHPTPPVLQPVEEVDESYDYDYIIQRDFSTLENIPEEEEEEENLHTRDKSL